MRKILATRHRRETINDRFSGTFDALLALQEALEGRLASDGLRDATASRDSFPPTNFFPQGDDFVAVIKLPGVNRDNLEIQANENTIPIAGKRLSFIGIHRRERIAGEFDRTLTLPVQINLCEATSINRELSVLFLRTGDCKNSFPCVDRCHSH